MGGVFLEGGIDLESFRRDLRDMQKRSIEVFLRAVQSLERDLHISVFSVDRIYIN